MYRTLVALALTLASIPPALPAQAAALGVEGGLSTAKLRTPGDYFGSRAGWLAGISATFALAPWFALQAGLRVHEKGAQTPGTFEMRLRYLEFPLLARAAVGRASWPVRLVVALGVAPATELSCTLRAIGIQTLGPPPPMRPVDCVDQRTDVWDFGRVASLGAEVRVGGVRTALLVQRTRGTHNIASGYRYGYSVHNDATSIILSASVPVWPRRPSNQRLLLSGAPVAGGALGATPAW